MKILAISDPHGRLPKQLTNIIKKNKPDLIVCPGDIPNVTFENSLGFRKASKKRQRHMRKIWLASYKRILNQLNSYSLPVIVLQGNTFWGKGKLLAKYKNVVYKSAGAIKFQGFNIVTADISYDMWHTPIAKRFLTWCKKVKPDIIISHAPPFGYVDKLSAQYRLTRLRMSKKKYEHGGVKVILKAIRKYKPKLVICGHVHEARGIASIGKTKVVNTGAFGHYAIIEIKNNKVNVKLK